MSHEKAVKRIVQYLKSTKEKGLIFNVDHSAGIECYVDADFTGGYKNGQSNNAHNCMSRTGYIIKYATCPIVWSSKLQTMIALSTTEAEYMALSTAMREVIHIKQLMEELKENMVNIIDQKPKMKINVFEDNVGAVELGCLPKLRPRTKHIAIQYHHF